MNINWDIVAGVALGITLVFFFGVIVMVLKSYLKKDTWQQQKKQVMTCVRCGSKKLNPVIGKPGYFWCAKCGMEQQPMANNIPPPQPAPDEPPAPPVQTQAQQQKPIQIMQEEPQPQPVKLENKEGEYTCPYCGKVYTKERGVKMHIVQQHMNEIKI